MTAVLPIAACSSMTLTSESGKKYWFRTCDIDTDIWRNNAHVVCFPANMGITFWGREKELCEYAVLGITNNEQDTWLLDGINSEGLAGGLLLLYEGTSVDKADHLHEGYVGMELVTKILSSCASVEEVIEMALKIQVCHIPYGGQLVPATMHYFFTDTEGNEVILEAADDQKPGIFTIYSKKEIIGVMTNSPVYPRQLDNLAWYLAAAPEFKNGILKKGENSLRIGGKEIRKDRNAVHLLKTDTFPASYCSYDRFVRLAVLKGLNEDGKKFKDDQMLAYGSGIMSAVFEPHNQGVFHYTGWDEQGCPVGQKDSCSQYLIMYDLEKRALYLRVLDMAAFVEYKLGHCDRAQVTRYQVKHEGMAGIIKGN